MVNGSFVVCVIVLLILDIIDCITSYCVIAGRAQLTRDRAQPVFSKVYIQHHLSEFRNQYFSWFQIKKKPLISLNVQHNSEECLWIVEKKAPSTWDQKLLSKRWENGKTRPHASQGMKSLHLTNCQLYKLYKNEAKWANLHNQIQSSIDKQTKAYIWQKRENQNRYVLFVALLMGIKMALAPPNSFTSKSTKSLVYKWNG